MPRIVNLGDRSTRLKGVSLIVGEGLCSNIYTVGNDDAFVIDTGVGNYANPVWPQLSELEITPEKVKGIVITHAHHDHAMGAFKILERADPKVFIHHLDTKYIASRIGPNLVKVEEGDIIETELWPLRVIWTPGHTEGGMCLYNEEERVLFSGDTVFPDGFYGRYDGESGGLEALTDSLRKLTELKVDIMLPGHGSPVLEGAGDHIERSYRNASFA
ncbi:MAG: MBL fold metallo-hydrolase [Candidatus Bathyarchaeota archaeon]|jgi:glyoxylase-like metal-dependent hydrolase (beta-lactamase superfamily II)